MTQVPDPFLPLFPTISKDVFKLKIYSKSTTCSTKYKVKVKCFKNTFLFLVFFCQKETLIQPLKYKYLIKTVQQSYGSEFKAS